MHNVTLDIVFTFAFYTAHRSCKSKAKEKGGGGLNPKDRG